MVFCSICGGENEEANKFCAKCGAPLKEDVPQTSYRRRRHEKYEKEEKDEKQEKQEKEEKGEKSEVEERNWGLLVGFLIILVGVIQLIDRFYGRGWARWDRLWPIPVIVFGLFIIWNGIKARERSPRP